MEWDSELSISAIRPQAGILLPARVALGMSLNVSGALVFYSQTLIQQVPTVCPVRCWGLGSREKYMLSALVELPV